MKRAHLDGRLFTPELTATVRREGGHVELLCPAVGRLREAPAAGSLVTPGAVIGQLEILGVQHRLRAPAEAMGIVLEREGPQVARRAVQWRDVLLRLDPEASPHHAAGPDAVAGASADATAGLVFASPLSGRYYARPGPDQPAFVSVGDIIETGRTVALLEVMKTFNRVTYGGDGLPARARVLAIGPADEDDVDEGDLLLRVEPA
ncbi:MAG: biotin/lipoyl-containing protein [Nannocystaceae bacterium]